MEMFITGECVVLCINFICLSDGNALLASSEYLTQVAHAASLTQFNLFATISGLFYALTTVLFTL